MSLDRFFVLSSRLIICVMFVTVGVCISSSIVSICPWQSHGRLLLEEEERRHGRSRVESKLQIKLHPIGVPEKTLNQLWSRDAWYGTNCVHCVFFISLKAPSRGYLPSLWVHELQRSWNIILMIIKTPTLVEEFCQSNMISQWCWTTVCRCLWPCVSRQKSPKRSLLWPRRYQLVGLS